MDFKTLLEINSSKFLADVFKLLSYQHYKQTYIEEIQYLP